MAQILDGVKIETFNQIRSECGSRSESSQAEESLELSVLHDDYDNCYFVVDVDTLNMRWKDFRL